MAFDLFIYFNLKSHQTNIHVLLMVRHEESSPREKPLECAGEKTAACRSKIYVGSPQCRQVCSPPLGRLIISDSKGSPLAIEL